MLSLLADEVGVKNPILCVLVLVSFFAAIVIVHYYDYDYCCSSFEKVFFI